MADPAAGDVVRASDIPSTQTYSAILRETSAQSLTNNTTTPANLTIVDRDASGGSTGAGWTVPVDGLYSATASGGAVANATGRVELKIAVNGTAVAFVQRPNSATAAGDQSVARLLDLNAADVVTMTLFQNSGGSINTATSFGNPCLTIALLVEL